MLFLEELKLFCPVQHDHLMRNDFDLFVDFRKKLPHSISQNNTYGD